MERIPALHTAPTPDDQYPENVKRVEVSFDPALVIASRFGKLTQAKLKMLGACQLTAIISHRIALGKKVKNNLASQFVD